MGPRLLLCLLLKGALAALPYTFIRALDFDPATGYRESHASACSRAGLQPTPPRAPLSGAVPTSTARGASSPWDVAAMNAVLNQLGSPEHA